jgi:hypothetical protein
MLIKQLDIENFKGTSKLSLSIDWKVIILTTEIFIKNKWNMLGIYYCMHVFCKRRLTLSNKGDCTCRIQARNK